VDATEYAVRVRAWPADVLVAVAMVAVAMVAVARYAAPAGGPGPT
jgi:hypothetical protein